MVSEQTTIWEMGFRLVRTFCQNFDSLIMMPIVKYGALAFGTFIVFSRKYLIPKGVMKRTLRIA